MIQRLATGGILRRPTQGNPGGPVAGYADAILNLYRHSKWLAMIERRIKVAKELLNPAASCLIVSIDEKE
ncbi:MAG: hypothetical protein ACK4WC_14600, partial [Rubrimonas sp.]